jgi:short-subunit dehydrogenase involved in D-alanine esterification of teichoic acids
MQVKPARIAKTKDAKESQKLLQEHMQTLQENMMASMDVTQMMMELRKNRQAALQPELVKNK